MVSDLKDMTSYLSLKVPTKQELVILVSHQEPNYVPRTYTYAGSGTNHKPEGAALYGKLKHFPLSTQDGQSCQFKVVLMKY